MSEVARELFGQPVGLWLRWTGEHRDGKATPLLAPLAATGAFPWLGERLRTAENRADLAAKLHAIREGGRG